MESQILLYISLTFLFEFWIKIKEIAWGINHWQQPVSKKYDELMSI